MIVVRSISIDSNGSIYILHSDLGRVTKWENGGLSNGKSVAGGNSTGNRIDQLNNPSGMFIEWNPFAIWIADTGNHRIVKWTSPSNSIVVCGGFGWDDNQFRSPSGLFVDSNGGGRFFVADTNNHRIQMWLLGATTGTTMAGQTGVPGNRLNRLWGPVSVSVDGNGILYIADTGNNRILRWPLNSNAGQVIAGDSTYGSFPDQFIFPYQFRFDSHGSLIVVDYANYRIQKFTIACSK